jgi:hypothetical protein
MNAFLYQVAFFFQILRRKNSTWLHLSRFHRSAKYEALSSFLLRPAYYICRVNAEITEIYTVSVVFTLMMEVSEA